ncbi:MAG: spondin domain-containing protein [Candidatus Latescibacteria bacterium]|nr:spondin domain-containing protein [Candidatus Latescibacterota bacterium]
MIKNTFYMFLILCLCVVFACGGSSNGPDDTDETANFLVTFTSTWSAATHPDNFPPNPHFSPLIGVVHNKNASLWKEGLLASNGIKQVAETGATDIISSEIDAIIVQGSAYGKISKSGLSSSPGTLTEVFTAHRDFPLVSLVSMLAPSPDWFVGVSGFSLVENNDWIIEKKVDLYVYDAGTDSGTTYTADNKATNPPEKIKKITGTPFLVKDAVISVGTFTFKRK